MLVLRRKPGQKVVIGDSIVIKVMEFANGQIALGFEVPRDVAVNREERLTAEAVRAAEQKSREGQ